MISPEIEARQKQVAKLRELANDLLAADLHISIATHLRQAANEIEILGGTDTEDVFVPLLGKTIRRIYTPAFHNTVVIAFTDGAYVEFGRPLGKQPMQWVIVLNAKER